MNANCTTIASVSTGSQPLPTAMRISSWGDRYFLIGASSLTLILCALLLTAAVRENQTIDENVHIAAGYSYFKTRDFRMNPEHPPLGKLVCALPLLLLNPQLPTNTVYWREDKEHQFGREFLYHNAIRADTLLFVGRLGTIAVTIGFAIFFAFWLKTRYGSAAALFGLTLFVFDPNVLAHGRYITTDMILTAFVFVACVFWAEFVHQPSVSRLTLSGISLGLALASKYSSLMLFPILIAIYILARLQRRPALSLRRFVKSLAAITLIAFAIVFLTYGAVVKPLISDTLVAERLAPSLEPTSASDPRVKVQPLAHSFHLRAGIRQQVVSLSHVPLPAHYYFIGLYKLAEHSSVGHAAYLAGRYSEFGWWYFFPVAFLLKTPLSVLLLMMLTGFVMAQRSRPPRPDTQVGAPALFRSALIIAALLWFTFSCLSAINIGLRHILPVYPLLYAAIATVICGNPVFMKLPAAILPVALLGLLVAESIYIFPHHLAFFNVLCGGPGNGPRYLLDSNIDWGQDLKNLKTWSEQRGTGPLCLDYWGIADPAYYDIAYEPLPQLRTAADFGPVDCVAVVSVQLLYSQDGRYQALRPLRPYDRIGYSIYAYDLRKPHASGPIHSRDSAGTIRQKPHAEVL